MVHKTRGEEAQLQMDQTIVLSAALFFLLVKKKKLGVMAVGGFAFGKLSALLENNSGWNNGGFFFNKC